METEVLKYGLPGVGLLAMGYFIMNVINSHRKERKEMFERICDLTDESNKVIREHTNMLAGIKALLENKK